MHVYTINALTDNLIYVVRDFNKQKTCVIDPSEAKPVVDFLVDKKWQLDLIINTHHHWDHVGGNLELKKKYQCPIVCSKYDVNRVPGADQGYAEGEHILAGSIRFSVLEVPGHTLGAITLYSDTHKIAFTGDTLFALGCGRLFEGKASQLWGSLRRLSELPENTKVYAGHDYLVANIAFCKSIGINDPELNYLWQSLKDSSKQGTIDFQNLLPTTIGFENKLNPFIKAASAEQFTLIRQQKDEFKLEDYASLR